MTADALRAWRSVRGQVHWTQVAAVAPVTGRRDGFVSFVDTVVGARDPGRAGQLLVGLGLARDAAVGGRPLSVDLLAGWHSAAVTAPSGFREGTAFAKAGRERYGRYAGIEADFGRCLGESSAAGLSLAARAARAYLDVCFFHPFDDGNGRVAMLAMYHLLLREHVVLDQAGPLLTTSRRADDAQGALSLARLIQVLAAATRRRGLAHPHN